MIKCSLCGTLSDHSNIVNNGTSTRGECPFCGSCQIDYIPKKDDFVWDERQVSRII